MRDGHDVDIVLANSVHYLVWKPVDVLGRHVDNTTEALREVENIYDSVREGRFGIKPAAPLTLRQVGEINFQKYLSPKTGRPLGRNEHYRWKLAIDTLVDGRRLGDYVATDIRKTPRRRLR